MSLKAYFLKNGQIQIKGNIDSKFKVEKNGQWSRIEEFVLNQIN